MQVDDNLPVYPISVAAKLLNVHPRTLRIYEAEGLICPHRNGGKRFFSRSDLEWIQCLRSLIHEDNISIEGIKRLLKVMPCWKIKNCSAKKKKNCLAVKQMHKKCREFMKNPCEKSCKNYEIYIKENLD